MNYLDAIKYPKTPHFDFSKTLERGDRILKSFKGFIGKRVIVTEKLDGENASCYKGYYHPRSVIDDGHPSRDWLKGFKANFDYEIPEGWRICGENMYQLHSIPYDELITYFYVFNIWNENNLCLDWNTTKEWCELLGLKTVPVIYDGNFDYDKIKKIFRNLDYKKQEGIICRVAHSFLYKDYDIYYAKAVRPNHIQTDEHWMEKPIIPNKLKK